MKISEHIFLKKTFKNNRIIFWVCSVFIICQLFVSYTKDAFTPFYNFGMYSQRYRIKDEYPVLEIYSRGKLINYNDFTLHQWNRILIGYDYCINDDYNTTFFEGSIERIMLKVGMKPDRMYYVMDSSSAEKQKRINAWKKLSEKILNTRVDSFKLVRYKWNGNKLTLKK